MLYANISALESKLIKLHSARIHVDAAFYMEVASSFAQSFAEFNNQRCEDGGLTSNACWMLGNLNHLQKILIHQDIHAFIDAFDELAYEDQCQINSKEWYSLGNEMLRLDCEIKECKKLLAIANQNCQLKLAMKDAGF